MNDAPPLTLLHAVGTRPNYVKAAAVLRAMDRLDGVENVLVDTGQHYDPELRDAVFRDLDLRDPDVELETGSGTHAEQTARVMVAFERIVLERRPDAVVVVGDVNSTLACALVAAKLCVPLVHVEAGLRSFDRSMPEEVNRVVTDSLATLLLTPSPDASRNLLAEGVAPERIRFVGNVMIDTLHAKLGAAREARAAERLGVGPRSYALLTLHRPENVDDPVRLAHLVAAVDAVRRELPVVFPIHPRTRARLRGTRIGEHLDRMKGVVCIPPLGYVDFLSLESDAAVVLTDSGGVQEETTALGVPCVTVRDGTERPITVTHGSNVVTGASPEKILDAVLSAASRRRTPPTTIEGWDGRAAERAAAEILGTIQRRAEDAA